MAQIKGWPITFTENGSFHELMKVSEDNQPIYYKTLNQNAANFNQSKTILIQEVA